MSDSILDSTKHSLNLAESYTAFDGVITVFINSAFSTLTQLGLGPADGFEISDNTAVWSDFIGNDKELNSVRSYVYLSTRLLFDPPPTSFGIAAMERQIDELAVRLNITREDVSWVNPQAAT